MFRDLHPALARYLGRLASSAPDEQLLAEFLARRDERAFAALVARHGPMVWGLCRRILPDSAAAEDVFQATFFVLARRAGRIRRASALAAWLHGVAYRLAVRAKGKASRLRTADVSAVTDRAVGPAEDLAARELLAALDEELLHLPERYRLPLVLCYLQGRTRDEAARELGWSVGTLRRRLDKGRGLLHARLARRGLTLSAGLAVLLSSEASAVPERLRSAVLAATQEIVPPAVVSLARSGGAAMISAPVGRIAALGACLAVLGICLGSLAPAGPDPARPPEAQAPPAAAAAVVEVRRVDEALRLAAEAVDAAAPNNLPMLRELAVLRAKRGDAAGARALFATAAKRAASKGPERVMPLIQLAGSLADAGDRPSALVLLEEALRLAPSISNANQSQDLMRLAVVVIAENIDPAKALDRVSLLAENERLNALGDIAAEQARTGDVAGALETIAKFASAPGYFRLKALKAVAAARLKAGDRRGAEATLRRSLEAAEEMQKLNGRFGGRGERVEVLCRYAVAQSKAGNYEGARATFARAEEVIGPENRPEVLNGLLELARTQAVAGDRAAAERTVSRLGRLSREVLGEKGYPGDVSLFIALEDWDNAARMAARSGNVDLSRQVCEAQARAGQADAALARARGAKQAAERAWMLLGVARGLLDRIPPERLPRYDGTLPVKVPEATSAPPAPPAPAPPDPVQEYFQIVRDYEMAWQALNERLGKLNSEADRRRLLEKERPQEDAYAERHLRLAREHPGNQVAFDALAWIAEFARNAPVAETAFAVLRKNHLAERRIGDVCGFAATSRHRVAAELLIRDVLDKSPQRVARGQACMALAESLKAGANLARHVQRPLAPAETGRLEAWYGSAVVRDLKAADPDKKLAEAEALYERVGKEFATLQPDRYSVPLGESARAALNEIRFLAVGRTAPDISGVDADGKPLRLSDHRGKVVVLAFWATWCSACRSEIPHEKEMVKRLTGRPFVLLGVNSDGDREKLRRWLSKEPLPWRSWSDGQEGEGDGQGRIARAWNVHAWPTVYVLDPRGVIRYRDVVGRDLDRAVDTLLKEVQEQ